jgi:chromosome segregation ATPase
VYHFGDDGSSVAGRESPEDLVRFIAPLVTVVQTEGTTAVAGGVSDDPGRIIYELEEKLKTANATISNQSADIARLRAEGAAAIERLQTEWQSEFTAAQQLRSENDRLQSEIERLQTELRGYAADSHRQLRNLQESHNKVTANLQAEQRGEREGFRIAISMILEGLK